MVAIIRKKLTNPKIEFWDTHGSPTQGTIKTTEESLYFRFRSNQFKVVAEINAIYIHTTDKVLFMNYYFDRENINEKFLKETLRNVIDWEKNENVMDKITKKELFQYIENNDLNHELLLKAIVDLKLPFTDIKGCTIFEWFPIVDENGIVEDFFNRAGRFVLSKTPKYALSVNRLCCCEKSKYFFRQNQKSNIKEQLIEQQEAIECLEAERLEADLEM